MTDIFAKRRFRLRAMKKLMSSYLPADQRIACPKCLHDMARKEMEENLSVCPHCGYHWPVGARMRMEMIMDVCRELDAGVASCDPLDFPGYREKLDAARSSTGLKEAVVTAEGEIGGHACVVCAMDAGFMMGSMGAAVGEKVTRAIEHAMHRRLPLVIFCASGGARMQEGILSLMQMAGTSAALKRFSDQGLLYISVLTHPTTGGVTASFASLGDVILAEPGALIGFAGPRVIEQTIGEKLPENFQRAEFMMEHGFVDAVIERRRLREAISQLLGLHQGGAR